MKKVLRNRTKAITFWVKGAAVIHALVEKSIKDNLSRLRKFCITFSDSWRRKAFYVTQNMGLEVSGENYKLFICTRDFHSEELRVPSFRWSSGIVKGRRGRRTLQYRDT